MGKGKLKKFAELDTFENTFQPSREEVVAGLPMKGKWKSEVFKNDAPLILELGCGRGEYSVALAERYPECNFVGIDLKGARIWEGAKKAVQNDLDNVRFLRVQIELIDQCFAENEVDEIWITFPDPQIKYKRTKHRMTNPWFLAKYRHILKPDGVVHLKTDSEFLYGYTGGLLEMGEGEVLYSSADIYRVQVRDEVLNIKTYYEKMWLEEGKAITYTKFKLSK